MSIRQPLWLLVLLAVIAWPSPSGLHASSGPWILHATDPHLWIDTELPGKPDDAKRIQRQRALNATALKDLLMRVPTMVGAEGEPRLLVLSGDVDADPCWIATVPKQMDTENRADTITKCLAPDPSKRATQVQALVDALADSPIHDILIVPGNNDVAREAAGPAALRYFLAFVADVQNGLIAKKSRVTLRSLIGCYAGGLHSECVADVSGTPYRLVGFPSYSFKNADGPALMSNDTAQQDDLKTFSELIAEAQATNRKVIVVTHVPNIDDPYNFAQDKFSDALKSRPDAKVMNRSASSTWNVTKPVLDTWLAAVMSDTVAAVLAGHLHDSHKEVYRIPYSWAPLDAYAQDRDKLVITPPLAVKNQDGSPIQARGASLINLGSDRVQRELLWYEPESHSFVRDRASNDDGSEPEPIWRRVLNSPVRFARWIWRLGGSGVAERSVLLIALLFSFLTVTRVWQIPALARPFAGARKPEGAAAVVPAPPPFEASPFAGDFGKIVIAGVVGLVAETFVKSFSDSTLKADKELYIVYFVVFFLLMLFLSATAQGLIEALRVRLAIVRFTPLPAPSSQGPLASVRRGGKSLWRWLVSWRLPVLVLADTFFQRIQGRNQTVTGVFEDLVVDEHNNIIKVIEVVRSQVNALLLKELKPPSDQDVRVNVSVMSADRTSVYYVATPAKGSSVREFPQHSVAWVSVFTGKIRWYQRRYFDDPALKPNFGKIVLFDNSSNDIPTANKELLLKDYYQERGDDYEAFVVIPIPWPRRDTNARIVGAVHISFRRQADFDKVWLISPDPVQDPNNPKYDHEEQLLPPDPDASFGPWLKNPAIAKQIRSAIDLLSTALNGFNENIFWYSKNR